MPSLPPEIDLNGDAAGQDSTLSYAENDPVTPLAPEATVSDGDSEDFEGGSLTVAFTAGGTDEDQLRITGGDFSVEESDLYYQGVPIGSVTGGNDGSTPLVVTFYAGVTADIAAALIRAVGYVNFSGAPVPGDRQIAFTLADGDGGTSIARTATVSVTAQETLPVAQDDMIAVNENEVATGSLFADNGNGPDTDPDGPALTVVEVNDSELNVGVPVLLDSGATLVVNSDGSYTYDPNGAFDDLADRDTGAANSSALDTFTYRLADGNVATVTVTVYGVASPGDRVMGDEGDNVITGTPNADTFALDQGGSDFVSGLEGSDIFYFGGAFGSDDFVDGGAGDDTLVLQGDYGSGLVLGGNVVRIEAISMLAGSNTAFGGSGEALYDYAIATEDSVFAAGIRARINGGALLAGEDFSFDGSAETDADFLVYGGAGTDSLTGGAGNDIFFFDSGRFAAGDRVAGGAGYDGLFLRGNYILDFRDRGYADLLSDVENLTLISAADVRYAKGGATEFDYNLILADSMVGQGRTLTLSGAALAANETMVVVGSEETDGFLRLFGGASGDTLIGGANADLIQGGLGGDEITGGGGADSFRYQSTAESSGAAGATDRILDFTPGTDRVELDRIDADVSTPGDQAFSWIGSEAFSGVAGQLRAYASGPGWVVEGDTNGDGRADLYIALDLQGETPLSAADFIL